MNRLFSQDNIRGIPRAPVVKIFNEVQYNYEKAKDKYSRKLPLLQPDDIVRYRMPCVSLIKQLLAEGHHQVVNEIIDLKQLEETEVKECRRPEAVLFKDIKLLGKTVDYLKTCWQDQNNGNYLLAAERRFNLAEDIIRRGDLWLANYFVQTAVTTAENIKTEESYEFQSKMHCLLAFIGRILHSKIQEQVQATIDHLEISRVLSRNKTWMFRLHFIDVKLRTPVDIYGLRSELVKIPSNSVPVYKLVTLIYFDMLMQMVTHTMANKRPTIFNFEIAFKLVKEALNLAKEIRQPLAVMSALAEYGLLLRKQESFDEATDIFQQLIHESMVHTDHETQAIALGNMAACLYGQRFPQDSLQWFTTQNTLTHEQSLTDLEADSLQKLGFVLLDEGNVLEAEQAVYQAYKKYVKSGFDRSVSRKNIQKENKKRSEENERKRPERKTEQSHTFIKNDEVPARNMKAEFLSDASWTFSGITAGQNLWGRLAGLCRQGSRNARAMEAILDFKECRATLPSVQEPSEAPQYIQEIYEDLVGDNKIPPMEACDLACIRERHKSFLKTTELAVPFSSKKTLSEPLDDLVTDMVHHHHNHKSVKMDLGRKVWDFDQDSVSDSQSGSLLSLDDDPMKVHDSIVSRTTVRSKARSTRSIKSRLGHKRISSYVSSRLGYDIIISLTGSARYSPSKTSNNAISKYLSKSVLQNKLSRPNSEIYSKEELLDIKL